MGLPWICEFHSGGPCYLTAAIGQSFSTLLPAPLSEMTVWGLWERDKPTQTQNSPHKHNHDGQFSTFDETQISATTAALPSTDNQRRGAGCQARHKSEARRRRRRRTTATPPRPRPTSRRTPPGRPPRRAPRVGGGRDAGRSHRPAWNGQEPRQALLGCRPAREIPGCPWWRRE